MSFRDEKSRWLFVAAALGTLFAALTAALNEGVVRAACTVIAVAGVVWAAKLRPDPDPVHTVARSPSDRVMRAAGKLVLWVVLGPVVLVILFALAWAGACALRGSCG
jgi:hypothetical protein